MLGMLIEISAVSRLSLRCIVSLGFGVDPNDSTMARSRHPVVGGK